MDNTSQWFNYLHTERKLTHEIIKVAGLDVVNGLLKIPIYNRDGQVIFSKYRKAPWDITDTPKYQYEKGAKVSLYGIDHISDNMIITEGELDALSLLSCGFNACTSTGGAMSFQEEWVKLFDKRGVTIMFDNDEAGIKGAVRTGFMFRKFTYRWVPPRYGKDISDVLSVFGVDTVKVMMHGTENRLQIDIPNIEKKKDMEQYRRELKEQARNMTAGSIGTLFLRAMILELTLRINGFNKKKVHRSIDSTNVERARKFPIENIVKVDRMGFTICPFHPEKTASMRVYPDNHAYCFGCNKRADAIDMAMVTWNVGFNEALKRLS